MGVQFQQGVKRTFVRPKIKVLMVDGSEDHIIHIQAKFEQIDSTEYKRLLEDSTNGDGDLEYLDRVLLELDIADMDRARVPIKDEDGNEIEDPELRKELLLTSPEIASALVTEHIENRNPQKRKAKNSKRRR